MHPAKHVKHEALRRQEARLARRLQTLDARSRRYGWIRLGLVLVGGMGVFLVSQSGGAGWAWSLTAVLILAFLLIARIHRRIDEARRRTVLWRGIKQRHQARMVLDWSRLPVPPSMPPAPDHPFQRDVNLTGPRSLHHLLNTASSRGGSERLRAWLLDPLPDHAASEARQRLVRELVPASLFRDKLALYGTLAQEDPETPWDGERLQAWLAQHTPPGSFQPLLGLLAALAVLNITLVVAYLLTPMPALWSVSLLIYVAVYLFNYRRVGPLFEEAYHLEKTLSGFHTVAVFLERHRALSRPCLKALCTSFRVPAQRPSTHLRRIARIAAAASSQKSEVLLVLLNLLGPWDLFFAYRLAQAKQTLRTQVPVWLDTWYTLEALCSLATFADLNSGYTFPTLVPLETPAPIFTSEQLGHPLLPETQKVCNDFALAAPGEIVLITGSNMSGKSTFLRTLGVNLCLAYAGAPVNAVACSTCLFRLFTCINVSDSVNDGISYFYAEVRRLKALLEALRKNHPLPLFFLIDEIFRGTNNRERLLGSRAYIQALAGSHGAGLIATHDLDLVRLADEQPGLRNGHFREEVYDGRMIFDYRLRPGPCPTTNALKIMKLEGLPVEPTALTTVDRAEK